MGQSTSFRSAGRQTSIYRGATREIRTKADIERPITARSNPGYPKLAFSVIQPFEPRDDHELGNWQIHAEAVRSRNAQHLSVIPDVARLAITLVSFDEINKASKQAHSRVLTNPEKRQRFYTKMKANLGEFLASQAVIPHPDDSIAAYEAMMTTPANPDSQYLFDVEPGVQFLNARENPVFGIKLTSPILPDLRNQALGFLEKKWSLFIDADPSSAGLDYSLELWPLREGRSLDDVRIKPVKACVDAPQVIGMGMPQTGLIDQF